MQLSIYIIINKLHLIEREKQIEVFLKFNVLQYSTITMNKYEFLYYTLKMLTNLSVYKNCR